MSLLGTPLRIDCAPGRRVLHVVITEKGEHRYPYEVCGLAVDYQTGAKRVVCLGVSGLRLFSLDIFERGFVEADEGDSETRSLPLPSAPEAQPEPVKVAGVFRPGPGW